MLRSYLRGICLPPCEVSGFKFLSLEQTNRNKKMLKAKCGVDFIIYLFFSFFKNLFFIYLHVCVCLQVGHVGRGKMSGAGETCAHEGQERASDPAELKL